MAKVKISKSFGALGLTALEDKKLIERLRIEDRSLKQLLRALVRDWLNSDSL